MLILGFQCKNLLIDLRAQLQSGILVQCLFAVSDHLSCRRVQCHIGIRQFLVIEDDLTIADETVAVQHSGEGLGKYRLTGTGLSHDGNGLIFIDIQRYTADRRQNTTADSELHL